MIDSDNEVSLTVRGPFPILTPRLPDRILVRAQNVFRPEIARPDSIRAAEQPWHFFRRHARNHAAELVGFERFAERSPNVAGQGIITGHTFIGTLQDDHVLLAAERLDDRRFREWSDHVDMD